LGRSGLSNLQICRTSAAVIC